MASREMSESMLMTASTDRLGLAVTSYDDSAHLNATAQLSTPVSPQRSPVSSHPLGVALGGMGGPPRMQRSRSSRVRPGTQSPRVSHKAYPFHNADTFTTTANVIQPSTNHGKDQSAAATGRGQRYSIDYTTLTEIDRMRASQQVDGWGKKDAWSSASGGGQSAPQTPLCKGRSTRRYRHSATRNSFRHNATTQPVNSNSNANNNHLNNNALTQQHAKQAVSPILSSRAPLAAVSSLTLTGGGGGGGGAGGGALGLSTLDPNQNHPNSPSSLSPISHLSHLGQPHRSVGRSQSVRTAKRPQTLENSTRFRQRIASIPGDRAVVGGDWEDPAAGATAASNASSSNSVYGAEAQSATGEVEVQRLRNFAVTSKGVVNRGDSFRSKANRSASLHRNHASSLNRLNVPASRQRSASGGSYNCIATQSGSNPELHTGVVAGRGRDLEVCPSLSQVVPTTALCASLSDGNRVMSQLEESARIVLDGIHGQSNPEISIETRGEDLHTHAEPVEDVICCEPTPTRRYRVLVVGAPEVGKTSLTRQFTTSEYICSYDSSMDEEHEKVVQIILNGEESELVFIEHKSSEALGNPVTAYQPDAYLVVFSVTSKSSFTAAKEFLQVIRKWDNMAARAIILVANKTDLVRLRAVSTSEGRSYASSEGIKFCETSAGINHNVDELLGGLLHQIRLKQQQLIKRSVSQRSQSTSLKILPLLKTKTQSASGLRGPHDSEGNLHSKQPLRAKMFLKKILRKACGTFGTSHSSCDNLHVL